MWESNFNPSPYDAHMRVIAHLTPGARVLDIGCNTGQLGEQFINRLGCQVVGVEMDSDAASYAQKRLHQVYCSSIEHLPVVLPPQSEKFDYVVAADVLEHTTWPPAGIRTLKQYLKPSGKMIVSLPNVANYAIRYALVRGRFEYGSNQVLVAGHYHFFTVASAKALLANEGFTITALDVSPGLFLLPLYHATIERAMGRFGRYRQFEYQLTHCFKNLFAFQFIIVGER